MNRYQKKQMKREKTIRNLKEQKKRVYNKNKTE